MQQAISIAAGQLMAQGLTQISQALQNLARDVIDTSTTYIREVEEMARATGTSVEATSRLIQVADDQRVSVQDLSMAIKTYSQRQAEAGNNTQFSIDELGRLSDEYLRLEAGTERNAFLIDNFGKAGLSMARMMEQGSASIHKMSMEVDESLIVTKEAIDAQREYEMALDDWDDAMTGVKMELSQALLPVLKDMVVILKDNVIPALKWIVEGFTNLPEPVQALIIGLGGLVILLAKLGPSLLGIVGLVQTLSGAGGVAGLGTALAGVGPALSAFAASAAAAVLPLLPLIAAIGLLIFVWKQFGEQASVAAKQLLAIVGYSLEELWDRITGFVSRMWEAGKALVEGLKAGFREAFLQFIVDALVWVAEMIQRVKDFLGIESPSKEFAKIGRSSAQGIGVGWQEEMPKLAGQMQLSTALLPIAAAGGINNRIGTIEYHGAFSRDEMARLDGRSERIAARLVERIIK